MEFAMSDEQETIRALVESILAEVCSPGGRAAIASERGKRLPEFVVCRSYPQAVRQVGARFRYAGDPAGAGELLSIDKKLLSY